MPKHKALFVCEHNSARSQMAEAFLKSLAPDRYEAQSAGITPGALNPFVVEAMQEVGIDISLKKTKGVEDLFSRGDKFDYVITVCDPAASSCPVFPGSLAVHWTFDDPSKLTGTSEEILREIRRIRDEIREKVSEWIRLTDYST